MAKGYKSFKNLAAVLSEVALPIVKSAAQKTLDIRMQPAQQCEYVKGIMSDYADAKSLNIREDNLISDFDFTAMWFFLFPFVKADGKTVDKKGAMEEYVAPVYGLDRNAVRNIKNLRPLRNAVIHENTDIITKLVPSCVDDFGAIGFIGQALMPLDLTVTEKLMPYREAIREDISEKESVVPLSDDELFEKEQRERLQRYNNMLNTLRKEYAGKPGWDFAKAPIGMPILGPAPWAEMEDDVEVVAGELIDFSVEENIKWKTEFDSKWNQVQND